MNLKCSNHLDLTNGQLITLMVIVDILSPGERTQVRASQHTDFSIVPAGTKFFLHMEPATRVAG